jgi:hypothetical protein
MHQIEQSSEIMGFQITSASQFPTKKKNFEEIPD